MHTTPSPEPDDFTRSTDKVFNMQSKGLSLTLQLLLLSCVLSMVLAVRNTENSTESYGSDSMDSDDSSESMENGLARFRDKIRHFYGPGSALRRALQAYEAQ